MSHVFICEEDESATHLHANHLRPRNALLQIVEIFQPQQLMVVQLATPLGKIIQRAHPFVDKLFRCRRPDAYIRAFTLRSEN